MRGTFEDLNEHLIVSLFLDFRNLDSNIVVNSDIADVALESFLQRSKNTEKLNQIESVRP